MDLKVIAMRCNLKQKGNYFLVIQLDELTFPEKLKKVSKFRTELVSLTSNPKFVKNIFNFKQINMGSRVMIKIGCFISRMKIDMIDTAELIVKFEFGNDISRENQSYSANPPSQ